MELSDETNQSPIESYQSSCQNSITHKSPIKPKKSLRNLLLAVVGLLLISLIIFSTASIFGGDATDKQVLISELAEGRIGEIRINGERITKEEVEEAFSNLPQELVENTNRKEVTNAIVNQKLLLQEAEKKSISVSDDEVDDFIGLSLKVTGMTIVDYQKKLGEYGVTEEQYREDIREQIMIAKLINQSIDSENYDVSEQEIEQFFGENSEDFSDILKEEDEQFVDELRGQVREKLEFQKKSTLLEEYINRLKDKASIK